MAYTPQISVYHKDVTVNFDDSSPATLWTTPAGVIIARVFVEVTTTWNDGGKAFTVGDAGDAAGFALDVAADLGTVGLYNVDHDKWGEYLWHNAGTHGIEHYYSSGTAITATFTGTGTGGTQGVCIVHIHWRYK